MLWKLSGIEKGIVCTVAFEKFQIDGPLCMLIDKAMKYSCVIQLYSQINPNIFVNLS